MVENLDANDFIERCTKSYGLLASRRNGVKFVGNIILKYTAKPVRKERELSTSYVNQTTVDLQVYENDSLEEEASVDESTPMYEYCKIKLTPGLPENAPIKVIFDLDNNGVLTISAMDLTNNIPLTVSTARIGEGQAPV